MSIPKEPRALMIQLMYLVLTAMLALNITREVLNAFDTINTSIENSNQTIIDKNDNFYAQFDKLESNKDEADKVRPLNAKAKLIKAQADGLYEFLNSWKDSVIVSSGGYLVNAEGENEIKNIDNIDAPTRIFVEEKRGDEIKQRLEEYVEFVLNQVDDADVKATMIKQVPIQLPDFKRTDENPNGDWSYGTFHNIPVIASVAMMTKYQNDVRNTESMVLEYLFKQIHADDIVIDQMMPIAVPNTSYALDGDEITATITLAAYNKAVNPSITSNRGAVQVQDGVGTLKFKASGTGSQTVSGTISTIVRGQTKSYPYKFDFMVGSAGASLELEKMNVMYIGVPNPVKIAAAGYNIQDVDLRIPDAKAVSKTGNGTYNIEVSKPTNNLPYNIVAKNKNGSSSTIATGNIRVKLIPPPTATIGGKSSGILETHIAKAADGVIAKLEAFDFDTRFTIVSFRFAYLPKNDQASEAINNGARFSDNVRQLIARSKPGDTWMVTDIKAKGPDGRVQEINPISLRLN